MRVRAASVATTEMSSAAVCRAGRRALITGGDSGIGRHVLATCLSSQRAQPSTPPRLRRAVMEPGSVIINTSSAARRQGGAPSQEARGSSRRDGRCSAGPDLAAGGSAVPAATVPAQGREVSLLVPSAYRSESFVVAAQLCVAVAVGLTVQAPHLSPIALEPADRQGEREHEGG
jgi:hypothetical protein